MSDNLKRIGGALVVKLAPAVLASLGAVALAVNQEWFLAFCRAGVI